MINNLTKISYDPPHSRLMKQSADFEMTGSAKKNAQKNAIKKMMKNENRIKREPANVNFCGLSATKAKIPFSGPRITKLMQNEKFKIAMEKVNDYHLVAGPAFALILTGIFRPASIMMLPGDKNKDDKKYASAHSIGSGIIGFIISSILFVPLGDAAKAFSANPKNFITKENSYLLKNKEAFNTAKTIIGRLPDIIGSVPKGILTIALIPPILKYVFGWEKKKPEVKEEPYVFRSYSFLNFNGLKNDDKKIFQNFMGGTK